MLMEHRFTVMMYMDISIPFSPSIVYDCLEGYFGDKQTDDTCNVLITYSLHMLDSMSCLYVYKFVM